MSRNEADEAVSVIFGGILNIINIPVSEIKGFSFCNYFVFDKVCNKPCLVGKVVLYLGLQCPLNPLFPVVFQSSDY